jgi:hypothetical protein
MTTGNELTRQEPGAVDLYLSGLSSLQVAAAKTKQRSSGGFFVKESI